MQSRDKAAKHFYRTVLDPEEIPILVTDDATLYDIFLGDDKTLIDKVWEVYEVRIDKEHFKIPFWEFLDYLVINDE